MNNKEIGNYGEKKACDYLTQNGYKIIKKNFRDRSGEIDIIAKKCEILCFIEVKTLPNATSDMLQKVLNSKKQKRIVKTAKRFLINNREYNNSYLRFDVIIIDMPGFSPVYHIENAFTEV